VLESLAAFYESAEKYVPNYNAVFLERAQAEECWEDWLRSRETTDSAKLGKELADRALRLWKKCRDWTSLGKALQELERYVEAIPYLKQAHLPGNVAYCYEHTGNLAEAARYYEEDHALNDAARCYELSGEHKHAAELYALCGEWLKA